MTARVPDGMSSVNAFDALYKNANVIGMGMYAPSSGESPDTPWNAVQIFKTYCHNGYCDYVRGKYMKVDFCKFPELDVNRYDKQYGQGSAQKAIDTYQKIMNKLDPKDAYDLNCKPYEYFTSYWKERTPECDRRDLHEMFSKCESLEESEKRVQKQISENSPVFYECEAKYTLTSPPVNFIKHDYKPCQEALDHFDMLLEGRGHEDTTVKGLSICGYPYYSPFFLRACQQQDTEVSLDSAKKLVEAKIPKKSDL